MRDYEELVKELREKAEIFDYDGWVETAIYLEKIADAIEELLKENTELYNSGRVLMAAFARLKERVPQWISVEERLPHYLDHVLCVNKYGIQMVRRMLTMADYIELQKLYDWCEKAADANRDLCEKALKVKAADAANLSAVAWFSQQELLYRYTIPGLIRSAVEEMEATNA